MILSAGSLNCHAGKPASTPPPASSDRASAPAAILRVIMRSISAPFGFSTRGLSAGPNSWSVLTPMRRPPSRDCWHRSPR
jgi:hypothetical protein